MTNRSEISSAKYSDNASDALLSSYTNKTKNVISNQPEKFFFIK